MSNDHTSAPPFETGFLSAEISEWLAKHRTDNAAWFVFSEKLNRVGCRILTEARIPTEEAATADPKLLGFLLLVRSLSNFQGTILMAERGMIVEARTLARACVENMFMIAALKTRDAKFVSEMLHAELANRKATANFLLADPNRLHLGIHAPSALQKLVDWIKSQWSGVKRLNMKTVSEQGGIADLYADYSMLSNDAAHPSVSALGRYIVAGTAGQAVRAIDPGPACKPNEIAGTLSIASKMVIGVCVTCNEMMGGTPAGQSLAGLLDEYTAMAVA